MTDVDLADVQGFILRGYTLPVARYIGLDVRQPDWARSFLAALVDPDPSVPSITSAAPWTTKPELCVNLGVTAAGLAMLGVPQSTLDSFPEAYTQGAAVRAEIVGDSGDSGPEHWLPWLSGSGPDLVLVLYAQSPEMLERATGQLEQAWSAGYAEVGRKDGAWLADNSVHFGFKDGLSQPTIEDVPLSGLPDQLPRAPVGEFLLGYPSQQTKYTYPVPNPPELGVNGSFAAFRVLAQDVDAFEQFLTDKAAETGMSEELIAAKLCGRWRNGTPLVLSPDTDSPDPEIPWDKLNDFDYVGEFGDERGYKCPIGSHIRRMYPRGQRVAGNNNHLHRIVRRGIPYGPPYDPEHPNDGAERGLLGLFIGVDLKDQFEFLMTHWANDGKFTAGLDHTKDPMIGAQPPDGGTFTVQHPEKPLALDGLARFISTRGAAYCFLPSISGIRYLAGVAPSR